MNIIPIPCSCENLPGSFSLRADTCIHTDAANLENGIALRGLLAPPTGFALPDQARSGNVIHLHLAEGEGSPGKDGYTLYVSPERVEICAPTVTGVFYGIQTLRQLLPPGIESREQVQADWCIPCVHIKDQPRFAWRGFMLDEARHFHGRETVLKTLDLMAMQKLNVFHWHLTDDQGWRVEIQKYPRLTGIGAQRPGTASSMVGKKHNGIPHAGHYSQQEIRAIVAYAGARHITVVPEIEMPGHCLAALAACPECSCTGGPFQVSTRFGIFPDVYCPGKEATFAFLQDVLDEVLELFPSQVIHIGGDEVPKKRWEQCPDCQGRIAREGLKNEHALQVWFTNRILRHLEGKGRRLMGWNQILEDGLAPSAVLQYWMGDRPALLDAIRSGRQVVMSTYLDAYLDHSYELMPLSRAYQYEPVPQEIQGEAASNILGVEFPLWSEWVPNRERMDYQVYPRLTAMAETAWSAREKKDLADFRRRLPDFLERLDGLGVQYAPIQDAEPPGLSQKLGIFSLAMPQKKTRH